MSVEIELFRAIALRSLTEAIGQHANCVDLFFLNYLKIRVAFMIMKSNLIRLLINSSQVIIMQYMVFSGLYASLLSRKIIAIFPQIGRNSRGHMITAVLSSHF